MKKICVILLVTSMLSGAISGCSERIPTGAVMEAEQSNAYVVPQLGEDALPIAVYVSPTPAHTYNGIEYPDLITEATYQKLADLGINFIMGHYEDVESIGRNMELCDRFGMAYIVSEHNAIQSFVKEVDGVAVSYAEMSATEQAEAEAELFDIIDLYSDHKSFAGVKFWDERGAIAFSGTASAKELFLKKYPDKLFYCNLLGGAAGKDDLAYLPFLGGQVADTDLTIKVKGKGWSAYLDAFLETLTPKILSYDAYPWGNRMQDIAPSYMSYVEIAAKKARDRKTAFWNFVQTSTWNDPDVQVPSYNQMAYNMNTSLLFGAQGLELFLVVCPTEFTSAHVEGTCVTPLDLYGNTTALYDDVKAVLDDIKAVDHVLMKSVYKGVMQSSEKRTALQRPMMGKLEKFNQASAIEADNTYALAGCFNYEGHTALYVVNASVSETETSDVTVRFEKKVKGYSIQHGETSRFTGASYTIPQLKAGEAALIVIE